MLDIAIVFKSMDECVEFIRRSIILCCAVIVEVESEFIFCIEQTNIDKIALKFVLFNIEAILHNIYIQQTCHKVNTKQDKNCMIIYISTCECIYGLVVTLLCNIWYRCVELLYIYIYIYDL
jgi:hypothetical protein